MQQVHFQIPLTKQQEQARAQLIAQLMQDSTIQAFLQEYKVPSEVVEEHAMMLKRWLQTLEKCEHCAGLAFCTQPTKGKRLDVKYQKTLYNELVGCQYTKAQNQALAHTKNIVMHDLSEALLKVTFLSIIAGLQEDKAYNKTISMVSDYLNRQPGYGLYFYGKPGVGKTYLAASILNYYAKEGQRCAFINVPTFTSTCKLMMQEKALLESKIRTIKQVDVLVMDDIGGEPVSPWIRDEILLPILNERMEKGKRTFFTSNFDYALLEAHYASNSNGSDEPIKANRLIERIKAMSVMETMVGINRRNVKKI
ncbi:MAG: ATP-binding protein [Erysipelotrichaceae bacterium]